MQPTTVYGGAFALELGDGANPENFTVIGAFKNKTFTRTLATSAEQVPDNDVPDSVVDDSVIGTSRSTKVSASGMVSSDFLATLETWHEAGAAKNIRLRWSSPPGLSGRTYGFSGWLTKLDIGAVIQKKATLDIEITADGPVTRSVT